MEINENNPLKRVYGTNFKKNEEKSASDFEQKQTEADSLDALNSYGRAQVNLNFKGNNFEDNEFKEKFKQLKQILDTKKTIDKQYKKKILSTLNKENIDFAKELLSDNDIKIPFKDIALILSAVNKENIDFAKELTARYSEELHPKKKNAKERIKEFFKHGQKQERIINPQDIALVLKVTNKDNINLAREIIKESAEDIRTGEIIAVLEKTNSDNISIAQKLYHNGCKDSYIIQVVLNKSKNKEYADFINALFDDEKITYSKETKIAFLAFVNKENAELALKIARDNSKKYNPDEIGRLLQFANKNNQNLAVDLVFNHKDYTPNGIKHILEFANDENMDFAKELINDKNKTFADIQIASILRYVNKDNIDLARETAKEIKNGEIPLKSAVVILDKTNGISINDIKNLTKKLGREKTDKLNKYDIIFACNFIDAYQKESISELSIEEKKSLLKKIIQYNESLLFYKENERGNIRDEFPLIPNNQEQYCSILPMLVKSIGIETDELSDNQITTFNDSLSNLSDILSSLSDEEFNNLKISQTYSKDEFIKKAFDILKTLPQEERQKVFDYFGFELKENKYGVDVNDKRERRYSITGYPVNLNNGKKLNEINNTKTKEAIEKLRKEVIKFNEENPIICSNKDIEDELNTIINSMNELRVLIGKKQHGSHEFDVLKHSLKVMQKISSQQEFLNLNESDKKLMLLASLLHDITKFEGRKDITHAQESAFDSFYISKKFKLSKEEEIKLYSIIKNHEWLGYVNTAKTQEETKKRQQSCAFDMQYENLFNMEKIFTIADLKSVKKDDAFYNKFKDDYINHSLQIEEYIKELKATKPLLPVTKIPKASRIKKAVEYIYPDGSTDIKGVYINKKGLVIVKYNEVEDFEKIGFEKGSVSKGYKLNDIDTGNIKFIVHGLDYANQLSGFDVFGLPDSDALLSVSYAERPESKYRFFRTQGVLLNTDTQFMHGGGDTDSGSGCKKDINTFKKHYLFGGEREKDRKYISDLIKNTLSLNDEEYIQFVEDNKNKSMLEIEDEEIREKLIKAFATINSHTRYGGREYNEMYITNPEVMALYAYKPSNKDKEGNVIYEKIKDVVKFVDKQKDFLKQYALDNDFAFFVFGD